MSTKREGAAADEAWRAMMRLMFLQRERVVVAAEDLGLSIPQAFGLLHLDADAPPSMRDLAGALSCDASFVTGIVDRLEELGLAERRVSAADRRVKELVLTPTGVEAQARLRQAWMAAPESVHRLSQRDIRDLVRVVGRLTEGLDLDPGANPFARLAGRPRGAGEPG